MKYVVIACVGNRLEQTVGAMSAFAKIAGRKSAMKPIVSLAGTTICNRLAAYATWRLKNSP